MKALKKICFTILLSFLIFACDKNAKSGDAENKSESENKLPNIIWLMAEDISTDLECYGLPNVKTPHLNKMAANGIRFDNAFVTNPVCSPSRSAMMVGTHQVKTNTHNHRSNRDVPLDSQFTPFTKLLRDAGYTTILGNHAVFHKGRKVDVNFKHKPIGEWDGKTKFGLFDKYDTFEKEDEPFFAQIQLAVTHRGDWWNKIRSQSKHPVDPKTVEMPPYMADHPAIRLDWAKYLDQIEYMDDEVGMIFNELEEKGMADNTIVIFIGDNGRCNIRAKGFLYDPGLRVPLIVYYPSKFKGGEVRKEVVSATDITASIIDFAGLEVPNFMTGKPIFSETFDREYTYAARDLLDEVLDKSRGVVSKEWAYIRNDKPEIPYATPLVYLEFFRPARHIMRALNKEGKLNHDEKLFFAPNKPKEELYNLKEDPYQLNNLAENKDYEHVLEKLRKETLRYDQLMKPVSNVYHPIVPPGTEMLVWVEKNYPKDYARMLAGEEIGFGKFARLYQKALKEKNSK